MKVIVQILNYNGLANTGNTLGLCMESLRNQTFRDYSIRFVDNASDDGSREYVNAHWPETEVVNTGKNMASMGNNEGLMQFMNSESEYLLLSNNDIVYEKDFLERFVEFADAHPDGGFFTPRMMMLGNREVYNSTGIIMNKSGYAWDRDFGRNVKDGIRESGEVLFASGGAMLIRRDALCRVGVLDTLFYAYYEDTDLSMRLRTQTDYRIYYAADAVCYHQFSASWGKRNLMKEYYMMRNRYIFVIKHFPLRNMLNALRYLYFTSSTGDKKTDFRVYVNLFLNMPVIKLKRLTSQIRSRRFPHTFLLPYHGPPRM